MVQPIVPLKDNRSLFRRLVIGAFLFFSVVNVHAQDSIAVFYPSGEYQLTPATNSTLTNFVFAYQLGLIDSIRITGYADSTGRKKQNLKLSLKRAKHVAHFLRKSLADSIPISYYAEGEQNGLNHPGLNPKRVVVVLFTKEKSIGNEQQTTSGISDTATLHCYRENERFLSQCHKTTVKKGKTNYVELTIEPHFFPEEEKYYTFSPSTRTFKLIKWSLENQGFGWWKRPQYTATVKASDLLNYGVFQKAIAKNDSTACYLCTGSNLKTWHSTEEIGVEVPVMQDLQLRKQPLDGTYLLIAPRTTIALERSYFSGSTSLTRLEWTIKHGKRNALYYFATVSAETIDTTSSWSISAYQFHCSSKQEESYPLYSVQTQSRRHTTVTETAGFSPIRMGLEWTISNLIHHEMFGAVYGQYSIGSLELRANCGFDYRKTPLTSLQCNYYFRGISCLPEKTISGTNHPPVSTFLRTVHPFAGTSFNYFFNAPNGFFQTFHLGIAYRNNALAFGLDRIYLATGYRYSYSENQGQFLCTIGLQFCF